MKYLYDFLLEEVGQNTYVYTITYNDLHMNLAKNPDNFKSVISSANKYANAVSGMLKKGRPNKTIFKKFAKEVWEQWKRTGFDLDLIPFRFDILGDVKLCRFYSDWFTDYTGKKQGTAKIQFTGGVSITIGNGSITRVPSGLSFEKHILSAICKYVVLYGSFKESKQQVNINIDDCCANNKIKEALKAVIDCVDRDNHGKRLIDELVDCSSMINYENPMASDADCTKLLLNEFKKADGTKDFKGIKGTGKDSPIRYINDITQNFDDNMVLHESGNVISDITIKNPNTGEQVNISIKEGPAQLSGITIDPVKNGGRKWMGLELSMDSVDTKTMTPEFKDFFSGLGLDPLLVKAAFLSSSENRKDQINIYPKPDKDVLNKVGGSYKSETQPNEKTMSDLAKKINLMIGGNYWYVKPGTCLWVPDDKIDLGSYNIKRVYLTGTGKTLNIKGTMGNIECNLTVRTSGGNSYRIFPVINMDEWLKYKASKK